MKEFIKCLMAAWNMTTWRQRLSIRFHLSRPYFHGAKGYRCMLSYTWKDDDYDEVTNWWTFVRVPTFIGKKFVNETMDLKDVTHD